MSGTKTTAAKAAVVCTVSLQFLCNGFLPMETRRCGNTDEVWAFELIPGDGIHRGKGLLKVCLWMNGKCNTRGPNLYPEHLLMNYSPLPQLGNGVTRTTGGPTRKTAYPDSNGKSTIIDSLLKENISTGIAEADTSIVSITLNDRHSTFIIISWCSLK